jgi:transcriptional regulator with XRE-family HTH domain
MAYANLGDEAVLREIGERLRSIRVNANLTQSDLARQAGVGRSTVERLESGKSTQLANFIRVLRVLNRLDAVLEALPAPGVGPMDLLELRTRKRERARRAAPRDSRKRKAWRWGDER